MTPEQLKQIAEWMGYEIADYFDFKPKSDVIYVGDCTCTYLGSSKCYQFNPLTNDSQFKEVLLKLKPYIEPPNHPDDTWWVCVMENDDFGNAIIAENESLELSVLQAALLVSEK